MSEDVIGNQNAPKLYFSQLLQSDRETVLEIIEHVLKKTIFRKIKDQFLDVPSHAIIHINTLYGHSNTLAPFPNKVFLPGGWNPL